MKIFDKRDFFKASFDSLLLWEIEYHKNLPENIKKCCYETVDPNQAFEMLREIEKFEPKSANFGYFIKRSSEGAFLLFFVNKLVDFISDVTINFQFYITAAAVKSNEANETIILDPNSTLSHSSEFTVSQHLDKMNNWIFFAGSISIFVFTYIADAVLVMTSNHTKHFKATMVGSCCYKSLSNSKVKQRLRTCYWYGILPLFNQIVIYAYHFYVQAISDYWKSMLSLKLRLKELKTTLNQPGSTTKGCKNSQCVKNIEEDDNVLDTNVQKVKRIQNECQMTAILSKIITASTENAFMPLLQLATLFPNFIALFDFTNLGRLETLNKTDLVKTIDWKFAIAITSIVSSLLSMSIAITETYFSKPGRRIYKTKGKWAMFFIGIVLQVVPKIFAYQVFCFGFVPYLFPEIGHDLIVPTLLILPLVFSFIRAMIYLCFSPIKSQRVALFFGLATTYVCSEHAFAPNYSTEESTLQQKTEVGLEMALLENGTFHLGHFFFDLKY